MQSAENTATKVVTTEILNGDSKSKKLNPSQIEIKDLIESCADWDEFEDQAPNLKGKNLIMSLESNAPYFAREENNRTKSIKLDLLVNESQRLNCTIAEILAEGLPRGHYPFKFKQGNTYLVKSHFACYIAEEKKKTTESATKKSGPLNGVNWQELIAGAATVAIPKIIENLTSPKSDSTQQLLLEHMRQQEEARREDRREMKSWMKENTGNDDPLQMLEIMQRLDEFKATLAKPPAPPPINTSTKWEKIAEKGLEFLSQQKPQAQAPPVPPATAPTLQPPPEETAASNGQGLNLNFDEQEVLNDLRAKLYQMLDNKEEPFKVLLGLRDLYVVGEKIGLQHIPEWEQSGGDAQEAFALFISKSEDQDYIQQLLEKAQEFIPLLGGAIDEPAS